MTGDESRIRILLVEDDDRLRLRLAAAFVRRGHSVETASSFEAVRALDFSLARDLVLVDFRLPDVSGLDLVRFLRDIAPGARIVLVTGFGTVAMAIEAMRAGADHVMTKPADVDELLAVYQRLMGDARAMIDAEAAPLDRVAWEHVDRVLASCEGNITVAARILGIKRRSLQRKLAARRTRDDS